MHFPSVLMMKEKEMVSNVAEGFVLNSAGFYRFKYISSVY